MGEVEETRVEVKARTLHVAASLLFLTAAFIVTKTGRDALYFQASGLFDLPKAYMGIAILSLPMSAVALGLMHVIGPRRARIAMPLLVLPCLMVFHHAAQPGGGSAMTFFFMFVPLVFGVLFALSWLLAAELLDGASRERLGRAYGLMGAASGLGGTAGALVAKVLAMHVEPKDLILAGAVGLGASTALLAMAQYRFPFRAMTPLDEPVFPGFMRSLGVLRARYVLVLTTVGMTAALVGLLVEFQFYLSAATSGHAGRENTDFFAGFYLALSSVALLPQLYLIPRLQRLLGVHGCLLILPFTVLGGTTALLAVPSPLTRALLRIAEGGLKASIHRANWEQAYLPLGRAWRSVAKILVDGVGRHVAESLAALLLYLWLRFQIHGRDLAGQDISWVSYLLLGTTMAWLGLTRLLGRTLSPAASAPAFHDQMRPDIPLPDS